MKKKLVFALKQYKLQFLRRKIFIIELKLTFAMMD